MIRENIIHFDRFSIILMMLCFVVSCSNKKSPIKDLEEVSLDLESNSSRYNEDDWHAVEQSLVDISNELDMYRDQYTDEEMAYIGQLKGKCAIYVGKHALKGIIEEGARDVMEALGAFSGVIETISKELNDSI